MRVREGKTLITDGPFAETKEQLSGFYMIEAPDLDAAIRIAAQMEVFLDCHDLYPGEAWKPKLARAIDEAARARDEELRLAVDGALGFVPRPLRGRIVKMLGTR